MNFACLLFVMSINFLLHNTQRVSVDKSKSIITFETECLNGSIYYFHLSHDQFLALDDAIALILRGSRKGHYPLGQKLWLHYFYRGAVMYDNTKYGQQYFKFENFQVYKSFIHRRIMSFIRLTRNENVAASRAGDEKQQQQQQQQQGECRRSLSGRRRRGRQWSSRHGENSESEGELPDCKRPLSVVLQPSHQSARTEKTDSERETSPRSTDNVVVSHPEEESSVLSEGDDSNSCWRNDSFPISSNFLCDIPLPETIDFGDYSSDTMDCQ